MKSLERLQTLADKLENDEYEYLVEHEPVRTPDRQDRGYWLLSRRKDGQNPSPPNRDSSKSARYFWNHFLRGDFIGSSEKRAKMHLESMLSERVPKA